MKNKIKVFISVFFVLSILCLCFSFAGDLISAKSQVSAAVDGGAIYLTTSSKYEMGAGTIKNKTGVKGGAVYVGNGSTFTMNGGTISGCSATYGGAIYVASGGKCYLNSGTISSCSSTNGGNAIYVENGGYVEMSSSFVISGSGTNFSASIKAVNAANVKRPIKVTPYVDGTAKTAINTYSNVKLSAIGLPSQTGCGWYKESSYTNAVSTSNLVSSYTSTATLNVYFPSHSYGSWVTTKAATCIATGTQTKTCSRCSDVQSQSIAKNANNHDSWGSYTVTKVATCVSTGSKKRTCSGCGATSTATIAKNPSNHTGGTTQTEGHSTDCMQPGYIVESCNSCSAQISTSCYGLHEFASSGEVTKVPTCSATGIELFRCTRENCVGFREDILVKDSSNHPTTATKEGQETSCTTSGYIITYCTLCNATTQNSAYSSHSYKSTPDSSQEATCTADGWEIYSCSRTNCRQSETRNYVTAKGHLLVFSSEYGGITTCQDCSYSVSGIASGCHVWYFEDMLQMYQCYNCGITAEAPHRVIATKPKDPTTGIVIKKESCIFDIRQFLGLTKIKT